ncbi:MAG: M48 family metallopeptidase [Planctomycetaceae bacterium]|nr:M48 family metallopeptidase [Planctomycetaceae bacterium]
MPYGSSSNRRGIRPQWIIAVILVLFGAFRFLTSSQQNPVTGEKQHVAMSVPQEIALGLHSAPMMAAQMGGEVDPKSAAAQEVRRIGEQLVAQSIAQKSRYEFQFHLLRDPETVNAFALPGGQIFITVGLLNRLQNEAQLAGVLGHEIGHVIHRHGAEHMAKGEFGQILVTAVGVAGSDERGSGHGNQAAAAMVNSVVQLRYGRQDESESDQFGLDAMIAAGFDPQQMLGVMKILSESSKGNRQPEWLGSHPHPEHRAEQIEAWLHQKYPDGVPDHLTVGRKFKSR